MYSIVDIETSGHSSKITEISIFIFDGEKVIDEYTTLVNPECIIPPFITNLTGITNAMVGGAPKFHEIANQVAEITKDTIFVAHNVNFDYNIIHKEFDNIGFNFELKKLCTIQLSRKLIPGQKSYSLGNLCTSQNIHIENRHRAKGDAEATTILFEKLIKLDEGKQVFNSFLNPKSKKAKLTPALPNEMIDELSEKPGVYYFKNNKDEIIYIGKANNIKKAVLNHYQDKSKKEVTMCLEISHVSFVETGSKLLSSLLESAEIKEWTPKYNRAPKKALDSIGLFSYEDRNGITHLAFNRLKLAPNPIMKFHNANECRKFLEKLSDEFELCPKYCHLQTNESDCTCNGICKYEESIEKYNNRVQKAIESIQFSAEHFVIKEQGRTPNEYGYVLIVNSIYKGFGYASNSSNLSTVSDYSKTITSQKDNNEVKQVLNSYLKENPASIEILDNVVIELNSFDLFAS